MLKYKSAKKNMEAEFKGCAKLSGIIYSNPLAQVKIKNERISSDSGKLANLYWLILARVSLLLHNVTF